MTKIHEEHAAQVLAAIDIGTNSMRLAVAQSLPSGRLEVLERLERPVRLGQDTFRRGRLRNETMHTAVGIFRDFKSVLQTYQADHVRAVATSAVREASNGDSFLDRLSMASGIEVGTISGAEESRMMIAAVQEVASKVLKGKKKALIAQVGGGSTVLNLLVKGQLYTTQSLPIGTIRQQEVLATGRESSRDAARLIQYQVSSALASFGSSLPLGTIQTVLAVGAAMRWAVGQAGESSDYENVLTLSADALAGLKKKCSGLSVDQLSKTYGLSLIDAETLVPSLLIHEVLLQATRAKEIWVPKLSMLDGLLRELARSLTSKIDESAYDQTRQSAIAIAKKYHVDIEHSQRVADLSCQLFDQLHETHRLDYRYRLLLEVAALVREIGTFVSSRSHHKHTLYILEHTEIFGLTQEEVDIVANVARYHRRGRPKPSHPDYVRLSREKRMIVNKLAALLRVADAVDIGRTELGDCELIVDGDSLRIVVPKGTDLVLEKKELASKSDMLQDIYGLDVQLEAGKAKEL